MVLAAIFSFSEHLVGTRYYHFFFFFIHILSIPSNNPMEVPFCRGQHWGRSHTGHRAGDRPPRAWPGSAVSLTYAMPQEWVVALTLRRPAPQRAIHLSSFPFQPAFYISEIQFQRHLPKHLLRERPSDGCPWGDVRKRKLASISGDRHSCKLSGRMPHGLRQLWYMTLFLKSQWSPSKS